MLSVEQLAQELNVTTRTIRNYLKEGKIKGTKIGGQWRFSERDIYDFLGKSDDIIVKNTAIESYVKDVPQNNEGLVTLTFSLNTESDIEFVKNKILKHFNSVYGSNQQNKSFEYQFLPRNLVRITLIGPHAYILNFGNWLTNFIELSIQNYQE
ncbi:helix-turn-helix domain-containing protein [Enterococcus faecalis]|uniref:helix-turn-helix domain-containing protein n=1 Tax=Enterococcus faecalis TaxID=1351 RepID=UPI00115D3C56|nr:helix-turn-helix domain-containing protein [Enterococcus faecalis]EGO2704384.1 helix-turn-helix domain-containing protein [Enterococcus faecalis]EGO5829259.1 helix-turn-helix domain-containing protein [Enterococcus faecalis]EGO6035709.1 helix-turn-helix domain-containing protein [Enterococcus faecalis]EHU9649004.1 helix-turn-helix domain-containing protein [Enterococcus faecalis]EHU9675830.1 helix-turn-helix domain-containing protein [Enterococcus faecalis]